MPVMLVPSGTKGDEAAFGIPEQAGHRVLDPKSCEVSADCSRPWISSFPYTSLTIPLITLSS